jgi:hypothetical protein
LRGLGKSRRDDISARQSCPAEFAASGKFLPGEAANTSTFHKSERMEIAVFREKLWFSAIQVKVKKNE